MTPVRLVAVALVAGPATLLAAGGAGPVSAAPPSKAAPAPAAGLRDRLRAATAELARLRRGAAAFRAELQLAADELPPTLAARFEVRLGQMEKAIQELTGKVEDLAYKLRQSEKAAAKFRNDVEFRLQELEKGRPGRRAARPGETRPNNPPQRDTREPRQADRRAPPPGRRPAAVTLPEGSPAEQYRFAFGLLRKARYDQAASAFRQFIKAHPRHRLAGNAHYWLGEAYYVQGDYKQAAILFADGFRQFPKHPKAPDILLKLGMTMAKLNKNQEACATLAELRRRFPDAGRHIRRLAAAERRKLGCSA